MAKKEYINELHENLQLKNQKRKNIVVQEKNSNLIYRYQSDIEQLKWRIDYLQKNEKITQNNIN